MKTGRVFLHKPHFPIKLSWKHLCAFFPLRAKKHFIGVCASEAQRLWFSLGTGTTSRPWAISQGPLHSSFCWGSFQLSKNLPSPKQMRAQGNNNSGPDYTLCPSVCLRNTFPRCRTSPSSGRNAACLQTTCRKIKFWSLQKHNLIKALWILCPDRSILLQIQWRERDLAALTLFFLTNLDKIQLWIFKISKGWESHMLAKSRVRVKQYLPLHFWYRMLWNQGGRTNP